MADGPASDQSIHQPGWLSRRHMTRRHCRLAHGRTVVDAGFHKQQFVDVMEHVAGLVSKAADRQNPGFEDALGLRLVARDEVAAFAGAHPDLRIVLDHFAHLEPDRPGNAVTLSSTPNVFLKITGLWTAEPAWSPTVLRRYMDHALSWIGWHRMLYGSSLPVEQVIFPLERRFEALSVLFAHLPEVGLRSVFFSTADEVYCMSLARNPETVR